MQLRFQRLKVALVSVFAVALALVSGAHALSSATARKSPEFALAVWPSNGLARERLAYQSFVEAVQQSLAGSRASERRLSDRDADFGPPGSLSTEELRRFAMAAAPEALRALQDEPLSPKAHAILALSQQEPLRREQILALASKLNRRDLALQGLVLESRVNAGDYPGTIATLDQILRVHTQRQAQFFPLLTGALRQSGAIPEFRDLLSKPLPWRDAFLMHAVKDPGAARSLAVLRATTDFENPDFDESLIANLARNGELEDAARLYRLLSGSASASTSSWATAYPPFDWTFADKAELRAQLSKDGLDLDFVIDPGMGGTVASRLVKTPEAPFTVTVRHQLTDMSLARDLKLSLVCNGQTKPFLEASFDERKGRFDVDRDPGCGYILLKIIGRSWTGGKPLSGSITDVLITAR